MRIEGLLDVGAKRVAALLALLPGVTKPVAQLEAEVQLIAPTLFGVFLEIAALAFGVFGFRPTRAVAAPVRVDVPMLAPLHLPVPVIASPPSPAGTVDGAAGPVTRRKLSKSQAEARVIALKRPVH